MHYRRDIDGLRALARLADPVGDVVRGWTNPNGVQIRQVRVPFGVVGIIYEARPNVTADAADRFIQRHTVIDAETVDADRGHVGEDLSRADPEMDDRHVEPAHVRERCR